MLDEEVLGSLRLEVLTGKVSWGVIVKVDLSRVEWFCWEIEI